ncbi:hypothetical protein AO263_24950 [Pseudomonas sp. NZIPFR-PS5]|nr:hypothetical protein AO263_24950 [Pseudomonas sp. NZIPFR-PS5]
MSDDIDVIWHTAFATVVTSDCSYRGFAFDADLDAGAEIVGVSLLAIAVGQSPFYNRQDAFASKPAPTDLHLPRT